MLNWTDTNLLWSDPKPILNASIPLLTEGMALVSAFEGGRNKVTPSTGSNTDAFIGIAMGPPRPYATDYRIDPVVVPAAAPYTVLLTHLANGGVGAFTAAGGQIAVGNGNASATNINASVDPVTGLTLLTFDQSFAGQAFTASYRYVMSAQEQEGRFGSPPPGFPAETKLGSVVVFLEGRISTNMVDPLANWFGGGGAPLVKVIAGGIFTDAGNAAAGIIPSNVRVNTLPSAQNPYLSMDLR